MKNSIVAILKKIAIVAIPAILALYSRSDESSSQPIVLVQGYYFVSVEDPCHYGGFCETSGTTICTYMNFQLWAKASPNDPDCTLRVYRKPD